MSSDPYSLLDHALGYVSARYAEDTSQMPPMVFGCRDSEVLSVLQLNFCDDLTKTLSIEAARLFLRTNGCDGSIFTSEAWMSVQKPEDVEKNGYIQPSKDANRVEILLCEISTPGHFLFVVQKMLRNEHGDLTGFEEVQRSDSKKESTPSIVHSRFDFFNGLPKETKH